jgi:uncharacterized membrane protein
MAVHTDTIDSGGRMGDPQCYLNLIFSLQSAYTASLIMMSQNRQDKALQEIYQELLELRKETAKPASK